jgi:hypothetical protein
LTFIVLLVQFTAVVFLWFMLRLLRQSKPNVFLIVDENPPHTFARSPVRSSAIPRASARFSYRAEALI